MYEVRWQSHFSSSNVKEFLYRDDTMELDVIFLSGAHYRYFQVPSSVYVAWNAADSKGKFHHAHIKGKYAYKRLS